jgi:DNA-binding FadR family transcriptional regulator
MNNSLITNEKLMEHAHDQLDLRFVTEGFVRPNLMGAVADHLRRIIGNPNFDGARLPGERELAISFNVSRPVLRAALARLEAEGRIVRRHGHGTRVCSPKENCVTLETLSAVLSAA